MKQALGRGDAVELKANWSTVRREVTVEAAEVCKVHEPQAKAQGQGPASQTNLRCVLHSSPTVIKEPGSYIRTPIPTVRGGQRR